MILCALCGESFSKPQRPQRYTEKSLYEVCQLKSMQRRPTFGFLSLVVTLIEDEIMPKSDARQPGRERRGMVLIIVLVVVVLLSLGAYTFSEFMVIEAKATAFHGKALQARALADSGVEFVSVMLGDRASLPSIGLYHNPGLFQGHLVMNSTRAGERGRFTVISAVEGDLSASHVRFGLIDESSKLNLNTIAALVPADSATTGGAAGSATGGTSGATTGGAASSGTGGSGSNGNSTTAEDALPNPLMGLPGMTLEISEAIFDWIDTDDDARTNGAENEYYQQLAPPYECKNGKLETLDEMLLIRGITPQMLFGEDANRNGLLDPNENDGMLSAPYDNADGILDRGWSAYLTVHSRELNLQPDRTNKVDVNSNTLSDVYDKLEQDLTQEKAMFIVAYRLNGAMPATNSTTGPGGSGGGTSRSGGSSSGGGGGSSGGSSRSSSGGSSSGVGGATTIKPQSASSGGSSSGVGSATKISAQQVGQAAGQGSKVTRAGMDLTNGGKVKINSVYDLVGVQVQVDVNNVRTTLDSPWKDDPGTLSSTLPELIDKVSVNGTEQFIEGRININQAHKEVLLGLPSMTEDIAHRIVTSQMRGSGGEPLPEADNTRSNTSWLLQEGIVDLPTLRTLDKFITCRGDVFRLQVMGHFDDGGPVARVEAIIDATQNPPQPIFFRDLTDLGRGYNLPVMPRQ